MPCAHDQDSDRVWDALVSQKLSSKESGHQRSDSLSYHSLDDYTFLFNP